MRDICVYQEFLTEAHKARIRETAEDLGFTPHFFTLDQFEEAKACLQGCEILCPQPGASSGGPGVFEVVLLLLRRGGPLLQGPRPLRKPGLPADQLQLLRRHHPTQRKL